MKAALSLAVALLVLSTLILGGFGEQEWTPTEEHYALRDHLNVRAPMSVRRPIFWFPGYSSSELWANVTYTSVEMTNCTEEETVALNGTNVVIWPLPSWLSVDCYLSVTSMPNVLVPGIPEPWMAGVSVFAPQWWQLPLSNYGPMGSLLSFFGWSPGFSLLKMNWNWLLTPNPAEETLNGISGYATSVAKDFYDAVVSQTELAVEFANCKVVYIAHSEGTNIAYLLFDSLALRGTTFSLQEYVEFVLFFGPMFGGLPVAPTAFWWTQGGFSRESGWPAFIPGMEEYLDIFFSPRNGVVVSFPDSVVWSDTLIAQVGGVNYSASVADQESLSAVLGTDFVSELFGTFSTLTPGWYNLSLVPSFTFCGTGVSDYIVGAVIPNVYSYEGVELYYSGTLDSDGAIPVASCSAGPLAWGETNQTSWGLVPGVQHNDLPFATFMEWIPWCFTERPEDSSGTNGWVLANNDFFLLAQNWTRNH